MRHYSVKFQATGYLFATLLAFLGTSPAHAAIIHESATTPVPPPPVGAGTTGQLASMPVLADLIISSRQYLASRFTITSPTQVTMIGGHFVVIDPRGNETIFGAIVSLTDVVPLGPPPGIGDFPSFLPATIGTNALALTTLNLLGGDLPVSADVRVPLSVLLSPGFYALVFGSGNSGAGGTAQMIGNNFTSGAFNPNPPSFFQGSFQGSGASETSSWFDFTNGAPGYYFVVEGTVVPLPPAFGLFAAGLLALGFIVLRRKRAY